MTMINTTTETPQLLYSYDRPINSIAPIEYVTALSWKVPKDYSTLRIIFNFRRSTSPVAPVYGSIYKNGVKVGKEWSTAFALPWKEVSEDIHGWSAGDTVEIRLRITPGGGWVQTRKLQIYGPSEPIPKPECSPGDKKAGYVCEDGKWVPYTPPEPVVVPEAEVPVARQQRYLKFAIPWLDLLPGIPYEPWMLLVPGFKLTKTL